MPRVSAFYGIVIFFLYNEDRHKGRPHFHTRNSPVSGSATTSRPWSRSVAGCHVGRIGSSPDGHACIRTSCSPTGTVRVKKRPWCRLIPSR